VSVRLDEIVARFGGSLVGDGSIVVSGIATLANATPQQLSFLANPKYRSQLTTTAAAAVILAPDAASDCRAAAIVTPQPYLYLARVSQWLNAPERPAAGIHPTAVVETSIPQDCAIGPHVWIGHGATIGAGAVICANCSIGPGTVIGAGSWLHPNVSVYRDCIVGERAIVHAGAIIGSDGFGFAREQDGSWLKIPQTGRVVIGNDVEIGAGTTIDRGALEDTVIEDGVKLDNQIQVGHNVRIGAHTAMAGCVGIAGSATIGRRCTVGGGAVILGHLTLADDVNISAGTLVAKSIPTPGNYTGTVPFLEHDAWLKNFARLRHLDAMADKIRALEARLAALEQGKES
jgi:UDP-3-O-[3-hydroxymyristoyl] glucosamine N-acyltransferase